MKAIEIAIASLLAAPLAVATPHHKHRHAHKRLVPDVALVARGPEETAFVYELNGSPISADDVCKGIQSGDLKWADGAGPSDACAPPSPVAPSPTPSSTSSPPPAPTSSDNPPSAAPAQFYQSSQAQSPSPSSQAPSSPSAAPSSSSDSGKSGNSGNSGNSGASGGSGDVSKEFPDGEYDCSYFPEEYGIMKLDYLGLGGWAFIQDPQDVGSAFDNIQAIQSHGAIKDGMYLGYACPKGTLQRQWPSKQGATGQSVGGILCKDGKLHKTNSAYNVLCSDGVGSVQVKNQAGGHLAICRTGYPGSEDEVYPLSVDVGSTEPLACPDASNFYQWKGQSTSAQYYINPPGTSVEDGCQWGTPDKPTGNFAPLNFGVGKKDGTFWISMMKNEPTTNACYPGTVELQGSDMVGTCKMENCQFTGSGATGNGCTVSSQSGDITYVVS